MFSKFTSLFGKNPVAGGPSSLSAGGHGPERSPIVELTERAAQMVAAIAERESLETPVLHLFVKRDGPTGYLYGLEFQNRADPIQTMTVRSCGIEIAVDRECIPLIKGTRIDYEDRESGAGFRFHNPNAV